MTYTYRIAECGATVDAVGPASAERFIRQFRSTWNRLPAPIQTCIAKHWRGRGEIIVSDDLPGGEPKTYGLVRSADHGMCVYFRASFVDGLPEGLLCDLIAHELAHVVQVVKGLPMSDEAQAESIHEAWGFDLQELRQWALKIEQAT